ncbi:MAG: substrate-binding domain-containing protein, partial [Chloroflexota bacterium]
AYRTVEHLISLGHRRIVCVSLPDQPSSIVERTQGYEQAMRDAGILPLASVPLALHKDRTPDNGIPTYADVEMAPITKLLSIEEPPTALFCINDFVALGVMQRVLAHGLSIPHDIAIAGFDDIAIAPHMPVPLTTVAQPKYEIGARAAELLVTQVDHGPQYDTELVLPTNLIVRASTVLHTEQDNSQPVLHKLSQMKGGI